VYSAGLEDIFDSQLDDPPVVRAGDLTESRRTDLIAGLIEAHCVQRIEDFETQDNLSSPPEKL
jgi:hypothetical protein